MSENVLKVFAFFLSFFAFAGHNAGLKGPNSLNGSLKISSSDNLESTLNRMGVRKVASIGSERCEITDD